MDVFLRNPYREYRAHSCTYPFSYMILTRLLNDMMIRITKGTPEGGFSVSIFLLLFPFFFFKGTVGLLFRFPNDKIADCQYRFKASWYFTASYKLLPSLDVHVDKEKVSGHIICSRY